MVPRGLYFGPKTIFIPPPFWKWYFPPSQDRLFFNSNYGLFALILPFFCNYFTLLLPLFSCSFPFLPYSFPFLPFSFTFFPFFSSPFHIFSPKLHRLIFFPPLGGGGFSNTVYTPLIVPKLAVRFHSVRYAGESCFRIWATPASRILKNAEYLIPWTLSESSGLWFRLSWTNLTPS